MQVTVKVRRKNIDNLWGGRRERRTEKRKVRNFKKGKRVKNEMEKRKLYIPHHRGYRNILGHLDSLPHKTILPCRGRAGKCESPRRGWQKQWLRGRER